MSDIGCLLCGTYGTHDPCPDCGHVIHIGSAVQCPHEKVGPSKGFEPYDDIGLTDHPVRINSPADRKKYMKPHWVNDYIVELRERG